MIYYLFNRIDCSYNCIEKEKKMKTKKVTGKGRGKGEEKAEVGREGEERRNWYIQQTIRLANL